MKVLLMLVGVFGGSLIGSVIGRLLGIDGVYTGIGSIVGAIGMYWLWRKYVDDENLESSQGGGPSRRTGSNDRAELLHEMMEERRRARIGRHRRNDDD